MTALQIIHTPGFVRANLAELEERVIARLASYKGLVLTNEQIPESKKEAANLRKEKKELSVARIKLTKDNDAAIADVIGTLKRLESLYEEAADDLTAQARESESIRKTEARDTLLASLIAAWDASDVNQEHRTATINDLVTLTAVTIKGNPTAKVSAEIKCRAAADRANQDRTKMRLLELANQSYEAGLDAPLTRGHVEMFLFADDETYRSGIERIITTEIERQKVTEARVEQRQQQEAEAEQRRQAIAPPPEVAPAPAAEAAPAATPVAPQANTRTVTIVCTFQTGVPAGASEAQVENSIKKQLEAKGFTSLSSVKATFDPQQTAA